MFVYEWISTIYSGYRVVEVFKTVKYEYESEFVYLFVLCQNTNAFPKLLINSLFYRETEINSTAE